jgi:hypothetical protein
VKNGAGYIREQLYSSLNGILPVFEEGEAGNQDEYIVLGNQTLTEVNDKNSLNDSFLQTIEVVVVNKSKKRLDLLGVQAMNALTMGGNSDFQVIAPRRESQYYLTERSVDGQIVRRLILIYNFLLIQR